MTHNKRPRLAGAVLLTLSMLLLPGQALSQGMCFAQQTDPSETGPNVCRANPRGMMHPSVQMLRVSLAISDKPLSYQPAKGPAVPLSFYYSQREAYQPQSFHYTNLGPKWTYEGLSYIIDEPARPGENVQRYKAGGGTREYRKEDYDPATGRFAPDGRDGSVLVRLEKPLRYARHHPDGTIETYGHTDAKPSYPRRHFLSERKDPAGNRLIFNYDAQNRLTFIEDATGKRTVLEYKHADPLKVTAIVDPFGRRAQIAYDARGRLVSITDALGLTSQVSYRGRGTFIDTLTTPYGVTRFASGNSWEKVQWVEITDPLGRTERVEARDGAPGIADAEAEAPRLAGVTNSGLSRRNTFYWDADAHAKHKGDYTKAWVLHWREEDGMSVGVPSSSKAPLESRQWYAYEAKTKTTGTYAFPSGAARVLPGGQAQTIAQAWNAQGNPRMRTDPLGRETKIDYAPNGIDPTALRQKGAQGWETLAQLTWDDQHRPLTIKDAAGQVTKFTWNAAGQLTSRTDALGATTKYEYNETGQLIKTTTPTGRTGQTYTYDPWGNLATETDSGGYTLKREYDAFDRPVRVTYPDGTVVEYTWDKLDLVMVKDRNGNKRHYRYDAVRNLVEVRDALRAIRLGYDKANRLVSLTDGGGQETRWQRDLQGRVIGKYPADSGKTRFEYDSAGRQVKRTDAQGQEQHLAYGKDNSLTRISYKNPRQPTPEVILTWDARYPRLTTMRDATGETRYRYAPVGQPGALQLAGAEGPSEVFKLRYGASGRVESWSLGGAAGEAYTFDALGRVTHNKNNQLGQFDYGYLGDTGQLISSALAGTPLEHGYGYEPNTGDRRLKEIRHPQAARSFAYTTAPNALVTGLTETAQGQSRTWNFTYDAIERLQSARRDDGRHYQYGFDKADNLINITTPEGVRFFNPGLGNKLNQAHYQHDPVGNRIADDRHRYTWDAENRLIKIAYKNNPQKGTEFRYDGQGRRVAVIETDGTRKTETRYTWCGDVICQARDAQGRPVAYYFGQGVYRPGTKERRYYAKDHLGSIRDVLDEKGQSKARYDYDPYGKLTSDPASPPEFGYAGMHYHAPSGLYLTKYRAYDPESGRWLSRDPIGEAGGINLYAYVGGNPVSFVDPLGLTSIIFDTSTGILTVDPEVSGRSPYNMSATSGRPDCIAPKCNETVKDKGPIPRGSYTVHANQISNPGRIGDIIRNLVRGDWGDWRVPLIPDAGTNTFGRSDFFLHGGSLPGSAGCIDFGGGIFGNSQTDQLLRDILNDPDGKVPVIVK